jgi:copper chaperone CopZ
LNRAWLLYNGLMQLPVSKLCNYKSLLVMTLLTVLLMVSQAAPAKSTLKRLDMHIAGASCAACLIKLEKKFRALPGMQKVMVSIYKPYAAVLIYDERVKMSDINKLLAQDNARANAPHETSVESVPLIITPR